MKRILTSVSVIILSVIVVYQSVEAAFEESVKVKGVSFNVTSNTKDFNQNKAVNFLIDLSKDNNIDNLTSTIVGPSFDNIHKNWQDDYLIKINNSSDTALTLVSTASYVEDIDNLRDDIFVNVLKWDDDNNNGKLDDGEKKQSFGYDSILRLKNDTFVLDTISPNKTNGYALSFDGSGLTEVNIGKSAVFDFEFIAVEE